MPSQQIARHTASRPSVSLDKARAEHHYGGDKTCLCPAATDELANHGGIAVGARGRPRKATPPDKRSPHLLGKHTHAHTRVHSKFAEPNMIAAGQLDAVG